MLWQVVAQHEPRGLARLRARAKSTDMKCWIWQDLHINPHGLSLMSTIEARHIIIIIIIIITFGEMYKNITNIKGDVCYRATKSRLY